jgi:hypothetical protein
MNAQTQNVPAIVDGFGASSPTDSPIHGIDVRFKDGGYFNFGEKFDVRNKTFAVLNRVGGWQKLQKECSPEGFR